MNPCKPLTFLILRHLSGTCLACGNEEKALDSLFPFLICVRNVSETSSLGTRKHKVFKRYVGID